MNRYENGKIYKIVDVGYNKCYIGSTCETLSQRMARHRLRYTQYKHGKERGELRSVNALFDEFGMDNCKIELVELYPTNSKIELQQREGYYIKKTCCVNKRIAGRTLVEYRQTFKEALNTKEKQRYKEKREEILQKQKEPRQCPCGSAIRNHDIRRHEKSQKHQNWLKQQQEQPEQEPQVEEQK